MIATWRYVRIMLLHARLGFRRLLGIRDVRFYRLRGELHALKDS